jgi:hypothetical protein
MIRRAIGSERHCSWALRARLPREHREILAEDEPCR